MLFRSNGMGKRNLLFVFYPEEKFDSLLSYAIDLAKARNENLCILMVNKSNTPASSNGHEMAKKINIGDEKAEEYTESVRVIVDECKKFGVQVNIFTVMADPVSAIENFLKQKGGIGMVLLGPRLGMSENITTEEMSNLAKRSSVHIFGMAKRHLYSITYGKESYSFPPPFPFDF